MTQPPDSFANATAPANSSAPLSALDVSIIVPTLNEADNLPELARRIDAAMSARAYEIIIADDNSRDRTPDVCAELSKTYPLRLLVRTHPTNGLSGAVLHGMAAARGQFLAVMDADLQHPPERLPALIEPLQTGQADFVIGSRYMPGGSTEAEWGFFRRLNSKVATMLARPFAGKTTDPMAGFFALKRETYTGAKQLTPLGYKIALELMCKCGAQSVAEIPIHFATRLKGESKLSLKQQFRYLEHLSRLYDFKFPRASPVVKFSIGVAMAALVSLAVYLILLGRGVSPARAIIFSYPAALLITAFLHLRYVRTQREFLVRRHPWRDFSIISLVEWIGCAACALWINQRVDHPTRAEFFIICVAAGIVVRYMLRKEFMQDIRGLGRDPRLNR